MASINGSQIDLKSGKNNILDEDKSGNERSEHARQFENRIRRMEAQDRASKSEDVSEENITENETNDPREEPVLMINKEKIDLKKETNDENQDLILKLDKEKIDLKKEADKKPGPVLVLDKEKIDLKKEAGSRIPKTVQAQANERIDLKQETSTPKPEPVFAPNKEKIDLKKEAGSRIPEMAVDLDKEKIDLKHETNSEEQELVLELDKEKIDPEKETDNQKGKTDLVLDMGFPDKYPVKRKHGSEDIDSGGRANEEDLREQIHELEEKLAILKSKTKEKKEKAKLIMDWKTGKGEERGDKDVEVRKELDKEIIKKEKIASRPEKPKEIFDFPKGFLWGTATSAYQTEGGIMNDWSQWEKSGRRMLKLMKQGKNPNHYICGQACDSYNRYQEDLDLAASLNNNAIRFGIEWSRIQPKKDTWDVEAINHYRDVLADAKKRGLKTFVTLWHWTNPTWFAKEGGWTGKQPVSYFIKYVEMIIKELGSDIDFWVVLNEPMMHVFGGYLRGYHPPQRRNLYLAEKVIKNLAGAYLQTYKKIHDYYPHARVGLASMLNYFEPANRHNPIEIIMAKFLHYYYNHRFIKKLKNKYEYFGVNYYFHDRMVWYPPFKKNKNNWVNDKGWEIYPEGMYHVLTYANKFKKPIYILENGVSDAKDKDRERFIKEHLMYVFKAIEEGADVRGYFHWSLLDNFEWSYGWELKFGLYGLDRKTFERQARPSAKVYADICRNNSVEL